MNPNRTPSRTAPAAGAGEHHDAVLAPLMAPDTGPAREWAAGRPLVTLHPDELHRGDTHLSVRRTFCFADLSGFTNYTRTHGPHQAVTLLGDFRRTTRSVAAQRGVRVAKWLGDGVMLVATDATAAVALGAHLIHHFASHGIQMRVGAATGEALLFEDDDYIGEPVNLAAKLCSVAPPAEMYAVVGEIDLPDWVASMGEVAVEIRGVGVIEGVLRLLPAAGDGPGDDPLAPSPEAGRGGDERDER